MEIIYVVLKQEKWDGETWDSDFGAFRTREDARKQLKKVRDDVFPEWEDETIDEDSEDGFYAFRDGFYDQFHINLYIVKMRLWNECELK